MQMSALMQMMAYGCFDVYLGPTYKDIINKGKCIVEKSKNKLLINRKYNNFIREIDSKILDEIDINIIDEELIKKGYTEIAFFKVNYSRNKTNKTTDNKKVSVSIDANGNLENKIHIDVKI